MVRWPRLSWVFVGVAVTAILSACGGGGSSVGNGSSGPSSSTSSTSTSTSGSSTLTFSAIAGVSASSITIPAASGATTISATLTAKVPSGVSAPSALTLKRNAQSIGGSDLTVYAVVALGVSSTVTLQESPAFSFTLSSSPQGSAYIAFFDENNAAAGWNVLLGPGTIANRTISFAAEQLIPPLTFVPGDTYLFALVTTQTAPTTAISYSGTTSTNYTYGFGFNCSGPDAYCSGNSPAPSPTPTTLSYNVTTSVSVGSNAYPSTAPSATLVDEHVSESDASNLSTTTYSTDSWVSLSAASVPYTVNLYGTMQTEPSSDELPVTTTIYGTPQTIDQFPQSASTTWSNSPAANVSYSYADGSTGTRVISSSGTYVDTENLLVQGAGGTITTTEDSDGSGSIAGPMFYDLVSSLAFSAPSGGNLTITINANGSAGASYFGGPSIVIGPLAAFYNTPPVFYTETDKINAGASLPGGCTPNSFGSSADDVNRTIVTLDTILGFEETTVLDSYEVSGVPICMTTSDTQNYAYDEQNNQPYLLILPGSLGLEVITTTESLVLQGSASAASAARTTASVGTASSARATVAAIQAHVLSSIAHARASRMHTYLQTLRKQNIQSLRNLKGVR